MKTSKDPERCQRSPDATPSHPLGFCRRLLRIKGDFLRGLLSPLHMSWFTADSSPALAWKELSGNSIRVVVTSTLMTNAAVYHASKTWDEHVRSSGLPESRDTAITLIRQFIARYVHDLIVKHNLKQLWDEREYISKDAFERVHSIADQKKISQR